MTERLSSNQSAYETVDRIRRSYRHAKPNPSENPAWANCHMDCGILLAEVERLQKQLGELASEYVLRRLGKPPVETTAVPSKQPCDHDLLQAAIALLREWGTTYADPRFPQWPPYGERIQEFLARVDSRSDETFAGRGPNDSEFGTAEWRRDNETTEPFPPEQCPHCEAWPGETHTNPKCASENGAEL